MDTDFITYVGLDVHKRNVAVAMLLPGRLLQLENKMAEFGCQEPYREPVAWLRCFRGIDTVTAVSLIAELHDFRRFTSARQLMSYLGLVPRERSSGEKERRGPITKAGNGHVRRLLIEAAWHNRSHPAIGLPLRQMESLNCHERWLRRCLGGTRCVFIEPSGCPERPAPQANKNES